MELDLEANRINDEGARALGLAVIHNKSLQKYVGLYCLPLFLSRFFP